MSVVRHNAAVWRQQRSRDVARRSVHRAQPTRCCVLRAFARRSRDPAGALGWRRDARWPVAASARPPTRDIDAPGLLSGPFITSRGLAWESRRGIMLTTATGRSTVLAPPDAPNWDGFDDMAWLGQNWWALARPSGVFAGRIGGALRELPSLRRCNPGSRRIPRSAVTYAVSDGHLYAALPAYCLPPAEPLVGWW